MTLLPYEKAKELEDAGWPQPDYRRPKDWGGAFILPPRLDPEKDLVSQDAPYSPSLSELIEACPIELTDGTTFGVYVTSPGSWGAGYCTGAYWVGTASGTTPELAVASLWLQLNKEGKV